MNNEIAYKECWSEDLKSFIYNEIVTCVNKLPIEFRDVFIITKKEEFECEVNNVS